MDFPAMSARRSSSRPLGAALIVALSAVVLAVQAPALRIVVIEGEDAVNIVQQKTATAPVVEVRDRNNQPVAGAVVRFAIQGGRATFGSARTLSVTTNAAGRAVAAGLTPTASGTLQISATAAFQGQTAAAVTIAQTNVITAAQAAALSSAGGAGGAGGGAGAGAGAASGGGFPTTLVSVAGAGVAGGVVAASKLGGMGDDNTAPEICQAGVFPQAALVGITVIRFDVDGCDDENDPLTYRWDFGDGSTAAVHNPTHVYTSPGTFTASLTVNDGKVDSQPYTISIPVASMTGRWRVGTSPDFFDFVQTGNQVAGTYTIPAPGSGTGTFTGSLTDPLTTAPSITLTLSGPVSGTLTAALGGSLDRYNVIITGGGYPPPFVSTTITRQ